MANDKLWVQIIFMAFLYLNIHIILVSDFEIKLYKRKYQYKNFISSVVICAACKDTHGL